MEISTSINLSSQGTPARLTLVEVYGISKTFTGAEMTFKFTVTPSRELEGKDVYLNQLVVDLYLSNGNGNPFLGRFHRKSIAPCYLANEIRQQQQIRFTMNDFMKLVDETHYKDLSLKLEVQAEIELKQISDNVNNLNSPDSKTNFVKGEGYITIPLSEWTKILNEAEIERFDLITLRTALPKLLGDTAFTYSFNKLKEAQDKFTRGDWNAVGLACRAAFSSILPLAKGEKNPIQKILAVAYNDPERKRFVELVVNCFDVLNRAVHQEATALLPTANFQREDALLCLHLTSAAISYIATIHKI